MSILSLIFCIVSCAKDPIKEEQESYVYSDSGNVNVVVETYVQFTKTI